jgi:hypothetical protein
MGRPRTSNKHLPKGISIIHGSYWFKPPGKGAKRVRVCTVGQDVELYTFLANQAKPAGPVRTMADLFDRYEREVIPTLEPRTQKDYRRHLLTLRSTFGHMPPNDVKPLAVLHKEWWPGTESNHRHADFQGVTRNSRNTLTVFAVAYPAELPKGVSILGLAGRNGDFLACVCNTSTSSGDSHA